MDRTIRISEEVYRAIQAEAEAFEDTPDSVLRRKYQLDKPTSTANGAIKGDLRPYIGSGHIKPGDTLVWERPRKGQRFTATVTANGAIQTSTGEICTSPSGAAVAFVGKNTNGWDVWVHEPSGLTLSEIRKQAR